MKKSEIYAGVDIGGTNTECGITDRSGSILGKAGFRTATTQSFAEFTDKLATTIRKLTLSHESTLTGIGIGAPNANYYTGIIDNAANLPWKGMLDLKGDMQRLMGTDVTVTNDANAAAAGEMIFGVAQGMKNFIMLTLGTGVGSGIVIDGRVVYGHTGLAGELGHVTVIPNGRRCGCGRRGCLETYTSATGIVTTARHLLARPGIISSLHSIADNTLNSQTIAVHAAEGDKTALRAFDYTARILGRAIANAVLFSSPEAIIISGGLARSGNLLLKPLNKYINKTIMPAFRDTFSVMTTGLHESDAAILGAAALAIEHRRTGSS
jgi:glucokinase